MGRHFLLELANCLAGDRASSCRESRQMAVVVMKQSGGNGVLIVLSALQRLSLPIASVMLRYSRIHGVNTG